MLTYFKLKKKVESKRNINFYINRGHQNVSGWELQRVTATQCES
jgi:hypothetical protein